MIYGAKMIWGDDVFWFVSLDHQEWWVCSNNPVGEDEADVRAAIARKNRRVGTSPMRIDRSFLVARGALFLN